MTTINTVEEIIEALDTNPALMEALRARLLTRELLEMPERLAAFEVATNTRLDALEASHVRLENPPYSSSWRLPTDGSTRWR